jgi:hypothetical protein
LETVQRIGNSDAQISIHFKLILGDKLMTPVVLRSGPYRFYFYSHEPNEPPHVHIDRDDQSAKFWLLPVSLVFNLGFSPSELRKIEALTTENQQQLLEAWYVYFGT